MLQHHSQPTPPKIAGAGYYRFKRNADGSPVLATLTGRQPKNLERNSATYDEIVKADRTGYDGIAVCMAERAVEFWDYPGTASAPVVQAPNPTLTTTTTTASASASTWGTHRVVVFDGSFDTHIEDGQDYKTLTLREVFDAEPALRDKAQAPAMIPSSYSRFDARRHEAQRQRGHYVALAADIDQGNVAMDAVRAVVRAFVGEGVAFLVYSSSSAKPDAKKWRIVVPLAEALPFAAWQDLQEAFFTFMEAQGVAVDWALSRAGQPVYLPNVPTDKRDWQGKPLFHERECVDGRGLTDADGVVSAALADLRAARERDEAERQRAQQAARQALQARAGSTKSAVIDAFNQAYSVEQMLEANGYERGPRDSWRSPYQSSKTFATRNFGDHWVSMSESDDRAGLGASCDAGRFGDAFDLFCHFDHRGDVKKAVRDAARMLGLDRRSETPVDTSGIMAQALSRPTAGTNAEPTLGDVWRDWRPPADARQVVPAVNLDACVVDLDEVVSPDFMHPHVVDRLVPQGEVTLFAGHGAAGKSYIALLVCILVALGRPFGTLATQRTRVLFFSAEDDKAELQRRTAKICRVLEVRQSELKGWLHLMDVSEVDPTLFRAAEMSPADQPTKMLERLATFVQANGIGLTVIDNASDVFDGNEIVRTQVRAFIRAIRARLARPDRAVVLLAHVSKAAAHNRRGSGADTTEDYSGSTAWHNSVRSRLSLDTGDKGESTLAHLKANKGPKADPIRLEWHDGTPTVAGTYDPPGAALFESMRRSAERDRDESDKTALVELIHDFDRRGERITTSMQGPYTVYKTLSGSPGFPTGMTSDRLNRLLRDLERAGRVFRSQQYVGRKWRDCFTCSWSVVESAPNPATTTQGDNVGAAA